MNRICSPDRAVFLPVSALVCLFGILFSGAASAATFVVNSGYDINDLEPGNGLCVAYLTISPPFVFPFCTLRGAIEEANALPGEDTIVLGSGTYRITLAGSDEDEAATGDLDITDSVRIVGSGPDRTIIDGNGIDRVIDIPGNSATVVLTGLTVVNGHLTTGVAPGQSTGGGLRNQGFLSLTRVVISDNTVGIASEADGGGLFNGGICSVTESTIEQNSANRGGGIYNDSTGILHIFSSTIYGNSSLTGAGLVNYGTADLQNTTLSSNAASGDSSSSGGAVWNGGHLHLIHCTVAENSASTGGGLSNEGTTSMVNTILAANGGENCRLSNPINSQGYNLISDGSCRLVPPDLYNTDPRLGPLRDNGGLTKTYGLYEGSPAIDPAQELDFITTDQRGVARPQREGFDIGAFEAGNIAIVPVISPLLLQSLLFR